MKSAGLIVGRLKLALCLIRWRKCGVEAVAWAKLGEVKSTLELCA